MVVKQKIWYELMKLLMMIKAQRSVWVLSWIALISGFGFVELSGAESRATPHWIWADQEETADSLSGKRYFRVDFDWTTQAYVYLSVACSSPFAAYVNGYELGRSEGGLVSMALSESGFVGEQDNVIAVEVSGSAQPAGLLLRGAVRGRSVEKHVVTDATWTTSTTAAEGWNHRKFDDSSWEPVRVLGPEGGIDPWREVVLPEQEAGAFSVPDGFSVQSYATPEQTGSVIAMTLDGRGRPIVSRENDGLYLLEDDNGDGHCDRVVLITDRLTNCQGICEVEPGVLYAIGHGPDGLANYRIEYDFQTPTVNVSLVKLALKFDLQRQSEHGPHGLTVGPDGRLYAILGNFAQPDESLVNPDSPLNVNYEGNYPESIPNPLRFGNGYGAPAGTIIRADAAIDNWSRLAGGFRNAYDLTFNRHAEIFTYDADMDWDFELPWYRPVRVNHVVDGADFGWRAGSGKWPEYQPDSLPALVDIGRGSPTGVITYQHNQFPVRYRDALFLCDWTRGQILVVHNLRDGGSYQATTEVFATGSPLNATDIQVAPDGSLLLSTGGRTTRGGVYRIVYGQSGSMFTFPEKKGLAESAVDLVRIPQPTSAWARAAMSRGPLSTNHIKNTLTQLAGLIANPQASADDRLTAINHYVVALERVDSYSPDQIHRAQSTLIKATADHDPEVRARAALALGDVSTSEAGAALNHLLSDSSPIVRRRACEGLIRSGHKPDLERVLVLLRDEDRWVRHAARITLERQPPEVWRQVASEQQEPLVVANTLLALARSEDDQDSLLALIDEVQRLLTNDLEKQPMLIAVRTAQLIFAKLDSSNDPRLNAVVDTLSRQFPTGHWQIDREVARIFAGRPNHQSFDLLFEQLKENDSIEGQIHYITCMSYIQTEWNLARVKALIPWLEKFGRHQGGTSYSGYIEVICDRVVTQLNSREKMVMLRQASRHPFVGRRIVRMLDENQLAEIGPSLFDLVEQTNSSSDRALSDGLAEAVISRLANWPSSQAVEILNQMYTLMPERRLSIARAAAAKPNRHADLLWRAMDSKDSATLVVALGAIDPLSGQKLSRDQQGAVLVAAKRLGALGADQALRILEKATGESFGLEEKGWMVALTAASKWFTQTYPTAEPLPEVETVVGQAWTFSELSDRLLHPAALKTASLERGLAVLEKAQCLTCHRFGTEGRGDLGPDLTLLGKRFDRNQILESILDPSGTVSDQYLAVLVTTNDGQSLMGTPIAQTEKQLTLALMDGSQRDIDLDSITKSQPMSQSLMPPGLLNTLTLEEIANMLAILESGPIPN